MHNQHSPPTSKEYHSLCIDIIIVYGYKVLRVYYQFTASIISLAWSTVHSASLILCVSSPPPHRHSASTLECMCVFPQLPAATSSFCLTLLHHPSVPIPQHINTSIQKSQRLLFFPSLLFFTLSSSLHSPHPLSLLIVCAVVLSLTLLSLLSLSSPSILPSHSIPSYLAPSQSSKTKSLSK